MPRSITVNYARLVQLDPGTSSMTVRYVVGTATGSPPVMVDLPTETIQGLVVIAIASTDTEAQIQQRMIGAICAVEGLNLGAGDHVFGTDGTQLV